MRLFVLHLCCCYPLCPSEQVFTVLTSSTGVPTTAHPPFAERSFMSSGLNLPPFAINDVNVVSACRRHRVFELTCQASPRILVVCHAFFPRGAQLYVGESLLPPALNRAKAQHACVLRPPERGGAGCQFSAAKNVFPVFSDTRQRTDFYVFLHATTPPKRAPPRCAACVPQGGIDRPRAQRARAISLSGWCMPTCPHRAP